MIRTSMTVLLFFLFLWCIFFFPTGSLPHYPPKDVPYTYRMTDAFMETSDGRVWYFSLPKEHYTLENGKIKHNDECFGKRNGVYIEAKGKRLYDFLRKEKVVNKSYTFQTNVDHVVQSGQIFYFECKKNKIAALHVCSPGNIFNVNQCIPISSCTNSPDDTRFSDKTDRHFYFQCRGGVAERKKCPDGSFFFLTQCDQKNNATWFCQFQEDGAVFRITEKTYIRCHKKTPFFNTCPDGMQIFTDHCESNECVGYPDGPKPLEQTNSRFFLFSPGYIRCKGGRVREKVICPELWDYYSSKGDNLTFLPNVFDGKTCTLPSFCENVQPLSPDIIVPVHDFTKYIPDVPTSVAFDQAVGIRCQGNQRHRIVVEPGMHISQDFRIKPACSGTRRRVVVGDVYDKYYDCDRRTVMPCPPNTFFNGKECQEDVLHAHRYKNIPIFKMNHLSPLNDWMSPNAPPRYNFTQNEDPDYIWLPKYNVWSEKECAIFPFLMQVTHSFYLPGGRHYCQYKDGKIKKHSYFNKFRLKFWSQRFVPDYGKFQDECYPGMKIRKGRFIMDNIFYATCDIKQPFVFCPSASTEGIAEYDGTWACKPYDRVYEAMLPAGQTMTLVGLKSFVPQASYKMNEETFEAEGQVFIDGKVITLWSEQDVKLYFQTLPTYPPSVYLEYGGQLKPSTTFRSPPFHTSHFLLHKESNG